MHPDPPKKEEELSEHVDAWQDKMRRLEAHGDEYKLPPMYKINALRMLMIGKSKEYFDLWEADRDPSDVTKSYEELLNKIKDYARKKKLDSTAQKNIAGTASALQTPPRGFGSRVGSPGRRGHPEGPLRE